MKSKVEVRKFAVEIAVKLLGAGTPQKDVITKAKEIETYIIGGAELPETYDEAAIAGGLMTVLGNMVNKEDEPSVTAKKK